MHCIVQLGGLYLATHFFLTRSSCHCPVQASVQYPTTPTRLTFASSGAPPTRLIRYAALLTKCRVPSFCITTKTPPSLTTTTTCTILTYRTGDINGSRPRTNSFDRARSVYSPSLTDR
ncbi:hypothetical protein F5Y03DRAFT_137247 [Xylaria venustula]|nr:hypothetical protein F5Y03DRAFT_137247 [Xylaria venustula]